MNSDEELKKILEEEQKKLNWWEATQRQESIEKYGKDIYTDKEIGMKKMRKINNIIDRTLKIVWVLLIISGILVLIFLLFSGWGNLYRTYVK